MKEKDHDKKNKTKKTGGSQAPSGTAGGLAQVSTSNNNRQA
jgi:hypothetical protein